MAQFECDECGVFFDDNDLVNCPNCNAPIGTFQLIQKKDGRILEERTATLPKGGVETLTKNIMIDSNDVKAEFTYKGSKPQYDKHHTYIDKIKELCSAFFILIFLLTPSLLFAQDSRNASKKEHLTQEQIYSLRKRFKLAGLHIVVNTNDKSFWKKLFNISDEGVNSLSQELKIPVDTLYMFAEYMLSEPSSNKENVLSNDISLLTSASQRVFFTQEQISSLRKRLKQAGLYTVKINGNYYWYYLSNDLNESANIISEKLKIPVDTLYILAESGFNDKQMERNKETISGSNDDEEYKFGKAAQHYFFTHPTMSWTELDTKLVQEQEAKNEIKRQKSHQTYFEIRHISNVVSFYFAYDPNVLVKYGTLEDLFLESITFDNNLKTYNGDFKLKGFGYGENYSAVDGIANYQYKEALDGSRIFEGKFSFSRKAQGPYGTNANAKGYFKNNKQVGLWTWDIPAGTYDDGIHSEIFFNENGLPVKFDISIGNLNRPRRSYFCGTFENGKLKKIFYKDNFLVKCSGEYNADGKPIGNWSIEEDGQENIIMSFDNNGKLIKSGYRDYRTGDWINATSRYPRELYLDVINMIRTGYFLRSTSF